MHKSNRKAVIAFFFLSVFMIMRVAGIHSFSHSHEDEQHCDLCEIIVTSEQAATFITIDTAESCDNQNEFFETQNTYQTYEEPLSCIAAPRYFYNKPPPIL